MHILAEIQWRPRIGDPTLVGWLTVWAYAAAAVLALAAARARGGNGRATQWSPVWVIVAMGMGLLCFNKQLDLQSLFTEIGREVFQVLGLYEQRRSFQLVFVLGVLAGAAGGGFWVIWRYRAFWARHRLLVVGLFFLLTFVVVRAISFHHADTFLRIRVSGVRMNWLLELTGIALVAAAALAEMRSCKDAAAAGRFKH